MLNKRQVVAIVAILALVLVAVGGVSSVWATGLYQMPGGGMGGGHHGGGHHGSGGDMGQMWAMHQAMHGGQDMPDECREFMDDPDMMDHMMQMMHGGMDPDECQGWMDEHGMSAQGQAECLTMMLHTNDDSKEDGSQQPQ